MRLRDRLWLLVSQAVNALAFGGDPDESLSARAWRQRADPAWAGRQERIDRALRYWGANHCERVYLLQRERERARLA